MAIPVVNGQQLELGHGAVYFDRFDASGNPTGERFLGECSKLELAGTPDVVTAFQHVTPSPAPLIRAVKTLQTELTVAMREYQRENLALVLMGDDSGVITQTGATVTGEVVAVKSKGRFYQLAHRGTVAAGLTSVVVKDATDTTTYVAGTDYDLDALSGRIYVEPGGAIAANANIHVTYTYPSATLNYAKIATVGLIQGVLRYIGNPVAGPTKELWVPRIQFAPDGPLSLIGDDFGDFSLKGLILDDSTNNPTTPYGYIIDRI